MINNWAPSYYQKHTGALVVQSFHDTEFFFFFASSLFFFEVLDFNTHMMLIDKISFMEVPLFKVS